MDEGLKNRIYEIINNAEAQEAEITRILEERTARYTAIAHRTIQFIASCLMLDHAKVKSYLCKDYDDVVAHIYIEFFNNDAHTALLALSKLGHGFDPEVSAYADPDQENVIIVDMPYSSAVANGILDENATILAYADEVKRINAEIAQMHDRLTEISADLQRVRYVE